MKAIPSHLLQFRVLSEVPRSEYSEMIPAKNLEDEKSRLGFLKLLRQKKKPQSVKQKPKNRSYSFNSAVWLSFAKAPANPISFWLIYRDEAGERAVLIDEQNSSEATTSAMLSGTVEVDLMGEVQFVKACVAGFGDEDSFRVDELYVQRESELADKLYNDRKRSA